MLYPILKPIRYKAPGVNFRKRIKPGDPEAAGISFDHLSAAEIELLQAKGIIGPAAKNPAIKSGSSAPAPPTEVAETKGSKK